jgi:hypothetical protein
MKQGAVKLRVVGTRSRCDRCGAEMRLFGIESHPTIDRSELRTFVCRQCSAIQTEVVPLLR